MSQFVTDTSSGSCVNSRAVAMSQSRDCADYLIIPYPSRAAVNRGLNAFPVSVTRWAFWIYSWVIEPKKPDRHHQTTRLKQPAAQRLWSNQISIKPENGIVFERCGLAVRWYLREALHTMKAVKPLRPSAVHRPCHGQGKHHPDVSVLALADMGVSPRLPPKPELWQLPHKVLPLGHWVNHQPFTPPTTKKASRRIPLSHGWKVRRLRWFTRLSRRNTPDTHPDLPAKNNVACASSRRFYYTAASFMPIKNSKRILWKHGLP